MDALSVTKHASIISLVHVSNIISNELKRGYYVAPFFMLSNELKVLDNLKMNALVMTFTYLRKLVMYTDNKFAEQEAKTNIKILNL